jgi:hypothetical protein
MSGANVMLPLSDEKDLEDRRNKFAKIEPGSLFDLGRKHFFIAHHQTTDKVWVAIPLTPYNCARILNNYPYKTVRLHFDIMIALNLDGE